ncbi:MAG: transglutaminase-like cysteine peptidase [Cellvibrionaceae bacterium]|nr:transglutaminase-like cysteine peptidase [Cellvibrionaceae bacterium]
MVALCCRSCDLAAGGASTTPSERFYAAMEAEYGLAGRQRIEAWFELRAPEVRDANTGDRFSLENANNYFNEVPWISDEQHWGQRDYWATPVEMLGSNGGDCEDFAVGKFFTLSHKQIDKEKLRITYVKSLTYNQAHMVLVYYPDATAEPLVLDNINKTILPASQRDDLVPVYSFNGDSIWLAKTREKKLAVGSQGSLPSWRDLNRRMEALRSRIERVPKLD